MMLTMHDIARQKGWPMISNHALQTESTRALMRRWKIRFWQVPGLVRTARRGLIKHSELIQPHPDIIPALTWMRGKAVRLAVITSNSPTLVRSFLDLHLPRSGIDIIRGNISLFGKHRAIKRLLREQCIFPEHAVYIGDEVRDVLAAKRAGVRSCAVTWGKERDDVLLTASPHYIARNAHDLREVIAQACSLI